MILPTLASSPEFAPESRVWTYTASRRLSDAEAQAVQAALEAFVRQWTAHNQALRATGEVFQNQFILLMVDETHTSAGGCSIDKSVHFLEDLGQRLHVDFFDRMRFAWLTDDQLQFGNRQELGHAAQSAQVTDNTLMVNTLVQNKKELQEKWLIPYSQSWHRRLV